MPKGDKVGRGYNLVKLGAQKSSIENIFSSEQPRGDWFNLSPAATSASD